MISDIEITVVYNFDIDLEFTHGMFGDITLVIMCKLNLVHQSTAVTSLIVMFVVQ